jgi:hypothetical protein
MESPGRPAAASPDATACDATDGRSEERKKTSRPRNPHGRVRDEGAGSMRRAGPGQQQQQQQQQRQPRSSASRVAGSDEGSRMGWRHYIAFVIAAFQTVLFPLVVFILVLVILTIILSNRL